MIGGIRHHMLQQEAYLFVTSAVTFAIPNVTITIGAIPISKAGSYTPSIVNAGSYTPSISKTAG